MNRNKKIVVVGAGLGGATAAACLQKAGFDVEVYEQATSFERTGGGIHVSANVIKVLRYIGAEERLSDIGIHPDAFISRKWDTGEILFELPLGIKGARRYGATYITVHRGDLHKAILERVRAGTVTFGKRLTKVERAGAETHLHFHDGSIAQANVVIGADGVNSTIRDAIIGPRKPRLTGAVAHRGIYSSKLLGNLEVSNCTKWWGPSSHALIYFIEKSREEIYFVTSAKGAWTSSSSWEHCTNAEVLESFEGFHPEVRRVIAAAPNITKWPIFEVEPMEKWSDGNLVLLGDACHATTPYMASGAAMAIEDATVLARCLDEATDHVEAIARYEATRGPRVRRVQEVSKENSFLRQPMDPTWVFGYDAVNTPLLMPA
jgi:6-hydroxynicotinate 3-monooxygenase